MFHLDGTTGVLTTSSTFDYETMTYYDISVQAEDGGGTAKSVARSLRVGITDVNDNAPVFNQATYHVSTIEGSTIDTSVVQVGATDVDSTASLFFAILSGNGDGKFRMDTSIDTIEINTVINLDVGDAVSYVLQVTVTDGSGVDALTGTATVYISVQSSNDHALIWNTWSPVYGGSLASYDISEDSAVGTAILTMAATDSDYGIDGQIEYILVSVVDSMYIGIIICPFSVYI